VRVIRRMVPGIGDAVMLEPTIRAVANTCHHYAVQTKYPQLFEGMYPLVDQPPEGADVIDLGEDCPAARYESAAWPIEKSRTQLFLEEAGFFYAHQSPSLNLNAMESKEARRFKKKHDLQIGLATVSARYGNVLDGWRDYPYPDKLAQKLSRLGHVVWFDLQPLNSKWAEDFKGTLRQLMVRVKSLSVMVAVDTAMVHLAGALSVPQFCLFGPTDPQYRVAQYPNVNWLPKYEKCGVGTNLVKGVSVYKQYLLNKYMKG
jgi:hypothetical protein